MNGIAKIVKDAVRLVITQWAARDVLGASQPTLVEVVCARIDAVLPGPGQKAVAWQAEWQEGMEKPEKAGVCACRQVVLIGNLAEAEETAEKLAHYIVGHHTVMRYKLLDHACSECVPGGPMVQPGFRCGYHEAKAILAGEADPELKPQTAQESLDAEKAEFPQMLHPDNPWPRPEGNPKLSVQVQEGYEPEAAK